MDNVHDDETQNNHSGVLQQKLEAVAVCFIRQGRNRTIYSEYRNKRQKECYHPNGTVALQFVEEVFHVFQVVHEYAPSMNRFPSEVNRVLHNALCNRMGKKNPVTRTGS